MTLRQKTMLWTGVLLATSLALVNLTGRVILLKRISFLEAERIGRQLQVTERIIASGADEVKRLVFDWGAWDDTYQYIADGNQAYMDANLVVESYAGIHVNLVLFLDIEGRVAYSWFGYPSEGRGGELAGDALNLLQRAMLPASKDVPIQPVNGLLQLGGKVILVAGHPIVTSRGEGPARGLVIFGRIFDEQEARRMAGIIDQPFALNPLEHPDADPRLRTALMQNQAKPQRLIRPLDEKTVMGCAIVKDLTGAPRFLLKLESPRTVYAQGQKLLQYFSLLYLGMGIALILAVLWLISRLALNPISQLSEQARAIARDHNFRGRLRLQGSVELDALATAVNDALNARDQAEDHLRRREQLFREVVEDQTELIQRFKPGGEITFVNEACCRFFGKAREDLLGQSLADLLSPAEWEGIRAQTATLSHTTPVADFECAMMSASGETRWLQRADRALFDDRGEIVEIQSVARDISDMKRAMEELQRLATAIDQAAESVFITTPDGVILYVNPAFEAMSGYSKAEAVGQTPRILKSDKQDPAFYREFWATLKRGEVWQGHFINKKKPGTLYEKEATVSPVFDQQGRIVSYVSVGRDVTREVELETQLRQSQKMEALGTLAGGIAHDFNNILQVIFGYTSLALNEVAPDSPVEPCLKEIQMAGNRARDLVRHILTFSQEVAKDRAPVQIQMAAREALKLLRGVIPSNIELHGHIQESCGPVLSDPSRIHQIVMNLATNAYHAVRDRTNGVIEISIDEVPVTPEKAIEIGEDIPPGRYARLRVKDNGIGMDPDTIKRIFQPFFTTKKPGEGTGLGLATVQSIVKSHQGAITVASAPGQGAEFSVFLPVCAEDRAAHKAEEPAPALPAGNERIMIVDDEEAITRFEKRLLEHLGYKVTVCLDSTRALKLFQAAPPNYDLVITDQAMPSLTGADLAKAMLQIRPELPIILCTGFSEVIGAEKAKAMGIRAFVMKPVVIRDLALTIRKVLHG